MKKCRQTLRIDDYLLDKLDEPSKAEFEEHYFNCRVCFRELERRNELISVVKLKGADILQTNEREAETESRPKLKNLFAGLTIKQWSLAAVSAAVIFIAILGVLPDSTSEVPHFYVNSDTVRGDTLNLISPVINIDRVPSVFNWESQGEDVEYVISLYNHELLWTTSTRDDSVRVPESVRDRMRAGERYSWQVKAFSSQGNLLSISSRVHFTLLGKN